MLEAQRSTKGFKMSILEFCAIVTMNHSHGILRELILQPKNQIPSSEKASSLPSMKTPKSSEKNRPRSLERITSYHLTEPELDQLCPCEVAHRVPWS
jgi:hypothetical protein